VSLTFKTSPFLSVRESSIELSAPTFKTNHIGGVLVSALASSVVDRGFESRSVQTKDYKIIDMCCFSAKHATLRKKNKDCLARIQDNASKWGDMLSAECCFSELALYKSSRAYRSCTKWTPSPFHWKLTCSSHYMWPWIVQEVVVNPLPYDHDTLPFYHIICMLYPKTQGIINFFREILPPFERNYVI
jgi:hypothetical protein